MSDVDRMIARAEEVFGDSEKALRWLRRPNAALGNVTPIELLETPDGIQRVDMVLGRIEHGIFS